MTDAASANRESVIDNRRFSRRRSNELVFLEFITGTTIMRLRVHETISDFQSQSRGRSVRRIDALRILLYMYTLMIVSLFFVRGGQV